MKNLNLLNSYRDTSARVIAFYGSTGDDKVGAFLVPSPTGHKPMRVLASSDMGWDHVSVSLAHRCPNWDEMEFVKRLFFEDNETAMQLHVPVDKHINVHPYTLHLWRPHTLHGTIPMPPSLMVG